MDKLNLKNYRDLVLEVRQLRAYVSTLDRALSSASSSQLSFSPKSPRSGGSAMGARVARYLEVKDLYEAQREKCEAQIVAIESAIQSLEAPTERLILRLRYMEGRSWASICSLLLREGYSERQVYYIHGAALRKLKEV